jgi:hypothetical protein
MKKKIKVVRFTKKILLKCLKSGMFGSIEHFTFYKPYSVGVKNETST